jgi:hypothetical protein
MTSQLLRRMAAVLAIVVGLVFASSATQANAANSAKVTVHKTHAVTVSSNVRTLDDWWW